MDLSDVMFTPAHFIDYREESPICEVTASNVAGFPSQFGFTFSFVIKKYETCFTLMMCQMPSLFSTLFVFATTS